MTRAFLFSALIILLLAGTLQITHASQTSFEFGEGADHVTVHYGQLTIAPTGIDGILYVETGEGTSQISFSEANGTTSLSFTLLNSTSQPLLLTTVITTGSAINATVTWNFQGYGSLVYELSDGVLSASSSTISQCDSLAQDPLYKALNHASAAFSAYASTLFYDGGTTPPEVAVADRFLFAGASGLQLIEDCQGLLPSPNSAICKMHVFRTDCIECCQLARMRQPLQASVSG